MARKKPLAAQLAPVTRQREPGSSLVPKLEDFTTNLLAHPNIGEALGIAGEYAGVSFDHAYSAEIVALEQDQKDLDIRFKDSIAQRSYLVVRIKGTPGYKKSAPERSGTDKDTVSLSDWRVRDLIGAGLALTMAGAAMVLGWSNVYANLMAGNPTFLERPWLAASLAMLLPIGSAGLKFVSNFIYLDTWRVRYSLFIYFLLFILLITWGVLFGMNFNGAAGEIDWTSLGEASTTATPLVYVQLLAEMVGATALYLAFEEIAARYAPDNYVLNAEHHEAVKALKAHDVEHEEIKKRRGAVTGRLKALAALREKSINEAVAQHLALRKANHPTFGQ